MLGNSQAEKENTEKERLAYIDPALADKAREDGNVAFKVRPSLPPVQPS